MAELLLLLSGDVELNPGPGEEQHGAATATTECTVTNTDTDTAGKDFTIGDVMKVLLGVQKDVAGIKQDGAVVRQILAELEEENKTLKQQDARLTKRVEDSDTESGHTGQTHHTHTRRYGQRDRKPRAESTEKQSSLFQHCGDGEKQLHSLCRTGFQTVEKCIPGEKLVQK
ncbi:hypothetical protein BaRGS_00019191 [Batillaria attramentaria]|uniref:Uncharacterized protein n=1 Tax=Batillaria attramentaria TaxID=370345 RepID=A0ABD0KQM6_9CAEN